MSLPNQSKKFQGWKVPDRVTTGESSRRSSRSAKCDQQMVRKSEEQNDSSHSQLPQIDICHNFNRHTSARAHSTVACTPRMNTGLAKLTLGDDVMCSGTVLPKHQMASPKRLPKGYRIFELLSRYYSPCESADQWIQRSSPAERQLIERALEALAPNKHSKSRLNSTLDDWLRDATDAERVVALDFFQTAGTQMAGNNVELKDRINQVIIRLKRGRVHPGVLPTPEHNLDSKFHYLRLLSPETRDQKWMHQTWHHLPVYRDTNPVNNVGAIYTNSHQVMKTHYIIHPNLG